ncbi:MAG: ADP-ribosylglycohydrolase family protein [Armatimonadia bacterium]|nr:ADP-ribosylglycohydrolase family protein [Armatimonadia bacterium]
MAVVPTCEARIRGCLLAGACGDALGAPVEFLKLPEIRARYGEAGIGDIVPSQGRITDDTQMSLFTVEGLIEAARRGRERGICHAPSMIHDAYLRWLRTQGHTSSHPRFGAAQDVGWLHSLPELNQQRAPGNTCLRGLESGRTGTMEEPLNDSKGCGGVMRVAPVGLAFRGADAFRIGAESAALTHGHPSGYLSAGALALMIAEIMEGADLPAAMAAASSELVRWPSHEETLAALDAGVRMAGNGRPACEDLERLGGGWVGEEALAISVCAALASEDLPDGLRLAANHSGDSDSTGAITGHILGAWHGEQAIPGSWIEALELHEEIERLAEEFIAAHRKPGV